LVSSPEALIGEFSEKLYTESFTLAGSELSTGRGEASLLTFFDAFFFLLEVEDGVGGNEAGSPWLEEPPPPGTGVEGTDGFGVAEQELDAELLAWAGEEAAFFLLLPLLFLLDFVGVFATHEWHNHFPRGAYNNEPKSLFIVEQNYQNSSRDARSMMQICF
jgi:hypothetical protein